MQARRTVVGVGASVSVGAQAQAHGHKWADYGE